MMTMWNGSSSNSAGRLFAAPRLRSDTSRPAARATHTIAFAGKVDALRTLQGFERCDDDALALLAEAALMRRLRRRQALRSARVGEHLLGVVRGMAGVQLVEDALGSELIVDVLGSGAVLGDWCWAGEAAADGVELVALEETVAVLLPRRALETVLAMDPALATRTLEQLATAHARAVALAAQNACFPVPDRLYCRLVELAHLRGREVAGRLLVEHGLTQSALASFSCASRENVNRHLNDWRSRGWIDFGRHSFVVNDAAALTRAVSPAARRVGFGAGDGRLPMPRA